MCVFLGELSGGSILEKIMLVFGTRPEAINTVVCVTGQHKQMLEQVLDFFGIMPDYNLFIMKENQTLFDVTVSILNSIKQVLKDSKPDVVLVHGDTSTTFATALACFYMQIAVGHVEAGLRTYDIYSPYPEELMRYTIRQDLFLSRRIDKRIWVRQCIICFG